VRSIEGSDDDYCVLGALNLFLDSNNNCSCHRFPSVAITLIDGLPLSEANPKLTRDERCQYVTDIILANDEGDFDKAWQILDEALKKGNVNESC
jgi:hypothetical protein